MAHTNAKAPPILEAEIVIDALTYGPNGIGRLDGKAVMIPHSVPGDRLRVRIVESKERYAVGEIKQIIEPSPLRRPPPCSYVGRCGGCSWQHLHYDAQLKAKEQSVADALRRIGKLNDFDMRPIIASPSESHYRRRIRLQIAGAKQMGLFAAASHDLIEIDNCWIAAEPLSDAIETIRHLIADCRTNFDHVEIVSGDKANEVVAVARTDEQFSASDEGTCEELIAASKNLSGLIVDGHNTRRIWGRSTITLNLESDISLELNADVFTQVNPAGNRLMIQQLLTTGNFQPNDRVLELYSGAGNFTLPIAKRVKHATAVEGFRAALTNGKLNAQRLKLENIDWRNQPVPQALAQLKRQRRKFSQIVLDPPRAGAKGIENDLAALDSENIHYISCNPTTMARDLAALTNLGYKLRTVQPIDFFPQTFHVETLASLSR